MTKQEKVKQLMESFDTAVFVFHGKPEQEIPYEFTYNGDMPIQCIQLGCGCTSGKVEGNKIKGVLKLDPKSAYLKSVVGTSNQVMTSKSVTVYFNDGQDFFSIDDDMVRRPNTDKISVGLTIQGVIDVS